MNHCLLYEVNLYLIFLVLIDKKKESSNDFIKWYQVGDKIYRYNITHLIYIESKNYQEEYNAEMMNSVSEMDYDAFDLNKIYKDIEFSEDSRSSLIKQNKKIKYQVIIKI